MAIPQNVILGQIQRLLEELPTLPSTPNHIIEVSNLLILATNTFAKIKIFDYSF